LKILDQVLFLLLDELKHFLHLMVFNNFLLGFLLFSNSFLDDLVSFLLCDVLESFLLKSLFLGFFSSSHMKDELLLDA
jgi:hypothetical protein